MNIYACIIYIDKIKKYGVVDMKKILKTVFVYIGLLIGAGFASGREILEYFNSKSNTSFMGILIASFLFICIAYIIISKASQEGICDFSSYIDSVAGKLSKHIKIFMFIYMFCSLFVMFSGSGALVDNLSLCPKFFGAVLMGLVCFIVLSFDLKGIVLINTILVPLMICGILYVSFCCAVFGDALTFSASDVARGEITMSAICYCAYNTINAGSVLVPLAKDMNKREISISSIMGGFIIGLLLICVWKIQGINFAALWDKDIPMMELAALCGKTCKKVYTAVLFMSICTTAVSCGFGLMSYFENKIKNSSDRIIFSAIICLAAIPPAMYGFSALVSDLYSFFGYVGMAWMIWIIIDKYK